MHDRCWCCCYLDAAVDVDTPNGDARCRCCYYRRTFEVLDGLTRRMRMEQVKEVEETEKGMTAKGDVVPILWHWR